jgi:hypothetical protein
MQTGPPDQIPDRYDALSMDLPRDWTSGQATKRMAKLRSVERR